MDRRTDRGRGRPQPPARARRPAGLDRVQLLERGVEGVAVAGDATERRVAVAADPDRHRMGDRLRFEAHLRHVVELAGEARRRIGEERAEQLELLVGPLAAVVVGHAEDLELLAHPPDADAEDHTPLRQVVEGGDRLGREHRRSVAEDQHRRAEPERLGAPGDEEQRADRVEPGHVDRRGERPVVGVRVPRRDGARPRHVVADPAGVDAELLGVLGELDQRGAGCLAAELREVDAPIHAGHHAQRVIEPTGRTIGANDAVG